jgi:hypothetical protein
LDDLDFENEEITLTSRRIEADFEIGVEVGINRLRKKSYFWLYIFQNT